MGKKSLVKQEKFGVGEFVFAKTFGYADWPSVILAIDGNKATVRYFNWQPDTLGCFATLYFSSNSYMFFSHL